MASKSYPEQEEEGEEVEEEVEVDEEEDEKAKTIDLSPEEYSKRQQWEREQEYLKLKLVEDDSEEIRSLEEDTDPFAHLKIVAGVDISFEKENPNHACAMLAILSYPQLKVLHKSQAVVEMHEPYIPGFLAFREVTFLLERLEAVQTEHPHFTPQVILVDGNGILHPRGFGLASHLGVLSGTPCVGVGKKLYHVDGLQKDAEHKHKIQTLLNKKGDHFYLTGLSGKVWGAAVRTSGQAPNPVYVSLGHKISLETAVKLAVACSIKRVPEPVRQADLLSRAYLRKEKRDRKK